MISNTTGQLGGVQAPTRSSARLYYQRLKLGVGHDAILRCFDCRKLVTYATLQTCGGITPCCGTRKTKEVTHLKFWEWVMIRLGIVRFPYRREFLAEFKTVRALAPVNSEGQAPRG